MYKQKTNRNCDSQSQLSLNEWHHSNLSKIKNNDGLIDYISKTGDILVDYYSDNKQTQNLEHQYLMLTDMDYRIKHSKYKEYMFCNNCNIAKLNTEEGVYVCTQCGETEYLLTYKPNYYDIWLFKRYTPYLKISYLKERLKQLQSRETRSVPDNIISIIRAALVISQIIPDKCTIKEIHNIMKINKLHKYYENIQQIYCDITRSQPIYIAHQIEQLIIEMFKQVETIYKKVSPKRRKFLNYSYILNKLFCIINMPDIAKSFNLLKSKKHLREHDQIFKKICKQLNWKFYPSF
jgi:hypothetical protein